MEHVATTDGITIHHGNNRFRQSANLHLHVKNIKTRNAIVSYITATPLHVHVTTRTKRLVTRSRQDNHPYVQVLAAIAECLRHFPSGQGSKGITPTLAVDGNLGYVIVFLEDDFLEIKTFNLFPFSHILNSLK